MPDRSLKNPAGWRDFLLVDPNGIETVSNDRLGRRDGIGRATSASLSETVHSACLRRPSNSLRHNSIWSPKWPPCNVPHDPVRTSTALRLIRREDGRTGFLGFGASSLELFDSSFQVTDAVAFELLYIRIEPGIYMIFGIRRDNRLQHWSGSTDSERVQQDSIYAFAMLN